MNVIENSFKNAVYIQIFRSKTIIYTARIHTKLAYWEEGGLSWSGIKEKFGFNNFSNVKWQQLIYALPPFWKKDKRNR